MTVHYFPGEPAVDTSGAFVVNGIIRVHLPSDAPDFLNPLDVTLPSTLEVVDQLVTDRYGGRPDFQLDDVPLVIVRDETGTYSKLVASFTGMLAAAQAAQAAAEAAQTAAEAVTVTIPPGGETDDILSKASGIDGDTTWKALADVTLPESYPAEWPTESPWPAPSHAHLVGDLRRSVSGAQVALTAAVLQLLGANDAAGARVAIGAGTGNGTSSLQLGTTAGTAAEATHTHPNYTTAEDVAALIDQLGGSGSGYGNVYVWNYTGGAYPALPAYVDSTWCELIIARGPAAPTSGWPSDIPVDHWKPQEA